MLSISHKCHKECQKKARHPLAFFSKTAIGQTSIELLAFFSMSLLIFSITYTIVFEKTNEAYDSRSRANAIGISEKVAGEINTAVSEGNGYSKDIRLPEDILGAEYNVSVDEGAVFVVWRAKNAVSRTTAKNITGNFTTGNNHMENKDGVIFVN